MVTCNCSLKVGILYTDCLLEVGFLIAFGSSPSSVEVEAPGFEHFGPAGVRGMWWPGVEALQQQLQRDQLSKRSFAKVLKRIGCCQLFSLQRTGLACA